MRIAIINLLLKMARGRKPKERKGYFYEIEEQAVIDYINTNDVNEKNRIFNEILFPALTKMIESIIRRYKLYVPDEDFTQTFNDTISYLMSKIHLYKPLIFEYEEIDTVPDGIIPEMIDSSDKKQLFKNACAESPEYIIVNDDEDIRLYHLEEKRYKAFSYCQTICKNYLMSKGIQYSRALERMTPYDSISEEFLNDLRYSTENQDSYLFAEKMIKKTREEISKMLLSAQTFNLIDTEIAAGKALIDLLDNWPKLIVGTESNKLQKNIVLYFLREETMMSTKIFRDNMKKFKKLYYELKEKELK